MRKSTITLSADTKNLLFQAKRMVEEELGRALSWDEFLGIIARRILGVRFTAEDVLALSDDEAEELLGVIRMARW